MTTADERRDTPRFAHPVTMALLALSAAASLIGRFVIPSPLWLDEALSVNIASLPLGDIPAALKQDGHPPLYYVILHGWIEVFGSGDQSVRALSGVISLAIVPLAWAAGRRLGSPRLAMTLAIVVALSPYVLRYGSETRMYSLVMALVFAGLLAVSASLEATPSPRSRWLWAAAVAATTSALLWTHYWSMWLIAATGSLIAVVIVRSRRSDPDRCRRGVTTLAALAVGCLTFLPWAPTLLYQSAHTGTPWAKAFRPATLIITSLTDFGGGPYGETQVLSLVLTVLIFLGVTGLAVDRYTIDIDLRSRPEARAPLLVLTATATIASVVGIATGMAFHPRYAAVFFPLVAVLVAMGIDRFEPGVPRDLVLAVFAVLSIVGMFVVFTLVRSQSREVAEAIESLDQPTFVVTCPDQLGPAVHREVDSLVGASAEIVAYPRLDSPLRVDWVDYGERNATNNPEAVADRILQQAGDRAIVLVYGDDYLTLEGQCGRVANQLGASRRPNPLVRGTSADFYEPMSAIAFLAD